MINDDVDVLLILLLPLRLVIRLSIVEILRVLLETISPPVDTASI